MTDCVQGLIELIKSNSKLSFDDEGNKNLAITVKLHWSKGDIILNIFGEEVIPEDFDKNIAKEVFVSELLDEIKKYSLQNIHSIIKVIDEEEEDKVIFQTKSCSSFRDKVMDLTGLNLLKITEVKIPKYNAELYFFIVPDYLLLESPPIRYFITKGNCNTSAKNSMDDYLARNGGENVSFMCNVEQSNQANLRKCVEASIQEFYKFDRFHKIFYLHDKKDEKIDANVTRRKTASQKNVVDLTKDDLDDSSFDEDINVEYDHDVYCEAHTSNDELNDNIPDYYGYFETWLQMFIANEDQEWPDENEYYKMEYEDEIINVEPKEGKKLSFSSGASCPSSQPSILKPKYTTEAYKHHQTQPSTKAPQLNRGIEEERINLTPTRKKQTPKSKLFNPAEADKWASASSPKSSTIEDLKSLHTSHKEAVKDYRIPKIGPLPRPSIHSAVYTTQRHSNQDSIVRVNYMIKKLVNYSSPTLTQNDSPSPSSDSSVNSGGERNKRFIDGSYFSNEKTDKKKYKALDYDDDDDVIMLNGDEPMEVDENQNHKTKKRLLPLFHENKSVSSNRDHGGGSNKSRNKIFTTRNTSKLSPKKSDDSNGFYNYSQNKSKS